CARHSDYYAMDYW
nr:immunoglobulin heavy chain junction region [Mus musculus]MBK4183722.1 immunoglobulin heavy chain junction region [Mus musculus]